MKVDLAIDWELNPISIISILIFPLFWLREILGVLR